VTTGYAGGQLLGDSSHGYRAPQQQFHAYTPFKSIFRLKHAYGDQPEINSAYTQKKYLEATETAQIPEREDEEMVVIGG
jgi:hypothetical protein